MLKPASRAHVWRTGFLFVVVAVILAAGLQGARATLLRAATTTYGPADCTTTWTATAETAWDPAHGGSWTPHVPGPEDVACIDGPVVINGFNVSVEGVVATGGSVFLRSGAGDASLELIGAHGNSSVGYLNMEPATTLRGAADLEVTKRFVGNGPALAGPAESKLVLKSSVGANAMAGGFQLSRTLVIEQGVTVTDIGGVVTTEGAVVDNAGTWNITDFCCATGYRITSSGFQPPLNPFLRFTFVNEPTGILRKTSEAPLAKLDGNVRNDGLIETLSGTLAIGSEDIADGTVVSMSARPVTVSGSGTFKPALVHNHGWLSPGGPLEPGVLHVTPGAYQLKPNSAASVDPQARLAIDVGGTAPGHSDLLDVAGACTLGGTLNVAILGGYVPAAGDTIEIVRCAGGVSGTFGDVNLPPVGSGLVFDVVYNPANVVLHVSSDDAGGTSETSPPTIVCGSADGAWHGTDISIPCTAADSGAGLANADDASFSLSTHVTAGSETGNTATDSRSVCDKAGNCALAGPIGGNKVDEKAPTSACDAPDGAWHASDVTLHCTADDAGSGLVGAASFSLSTQVPDGVETADAVTEIHSICDTAGNCSLAGAAGGNKVDKKAPTIDCDAPDGVWHASHAVLGCRASDAGFGLMGPLDVRFPLFTHVPVGEEIADAATDTRLVCDQGGNCTTAGPIGGNKVDNKAPTTVATRSPEPDAGGVNRPAVTVTLAAADGGSGVKEITYSASGAQAIAQTTVAGNQATVHLSADGVTTLTFSAVDNVGNKAGAKNLAVEIAPLDSTPPTITPTIAGTLGDNGWYTSGVTVSWAVADSESTPTFTCPDQTVQTDTVGVTFTCTASSAGGSASKSVTIKRDATAPVATPFLEPAPNGYGWNNSDVTVSAHGTDKTSGIYSCGSYNGGFGPLAPHTIDVEVVGLVVQSLCRDNAGNESFAPVTVNIDKTEPSLVFGEPTPSANDTGWYHTDVAVPFTATDALSGVDPANPPSPIVLSEEGWSTAHVTIRDRAGNQQTFATGIGPFAFRIDKTPPVVHTYTVPGANAYGWHNTNVFVGATGEDALSGIEGCDYRDLDTEGGGQHVRLACRDLAGNVAYASTIVNIDLTAPTVTVHDPIPAANNLGWNNTDVSIPFEVHDSTSGPDPANMSSPIVLSGDGRYGMGEFGPILFISDKAGNSTRLPEYRKVKIDKTPPVVTFSGNAGTYTVEQTISISCAASDPTRADGLEGSGLASKSCTSSNGPAYGFGLGSHRVLATAIDNAGNSTTATTTFTVTVAAGSLGTLTTQFVQGSAKYQALPSSLRVAVDTLAANLSRQLNSLVPSLTPTQKAVFITVYKNSVSALASLGWLTPAQAATLKTLAGAL